MAAVPATSKNLIGQALKRKEDPRLIAGISHYTDDLRPAGVCHMAVLRSPYAHARIKHINVTAARKLRGVLSVVTGADVAGKIGPIPCAADIPGLKRPVTTVLATDRVRYVGHPVAAVVAETRYIARDALDLIEVDYEPLPAVVDPEKAMHAESTRLYDEFKDNIAFEYKLESGDVDGAFKKAQKIIRQRIINQRLVPVAMEPRAVLAEYLPGEGTLTVHSSTQIPHLLKTQVALMVGLPETKVRVVAPEVGGGFGSKLNVYAEEGLAPYFAMRLNRPVKWAEGRRENMQATIHGRDQIADVHIAVRNDGTITGLAVKLIADLGAYHQLLTPLIPTLTPLMALGCYKIPAVRVELVGVFTNKMATDAYRGAGRPEATYMIERAVDLVAAELGKDPVEIRQKNFPKPKDFPFTSATGVVFDSGNYQASLKKALDLSGYAKLRKKQAEQRKRMAAGEIPEKLLGIGVSTYVEICAMGPSSAMPAGGWESCTVRIEPTAQVTVLTGSSPHGQGQETTFAQIVGQMMGISAESVNVVHGDTQAVPYGIGTFGSRATAVGGAAMYKAVEKLKQKMALIAGHLLGIKPKGFKPEEMVFSGGRIFHKRQPKKSVAFGEVVGAAYVAKNLPPGVDPGLDATHFFEPSNFTFPFGAHICVVEVDTETGDVRISKYVAVDDCGNIINPLLVRGQVHGGIAQGLGQALFEEAVYDENGQLITGTLMDYAVPKAGQLPVYITDHTCTPSPVNPMGVKGVGEAGTIGSVPSLVNAVVDALHPFGVRHLDMPLKPEKVWRAMKKK
jgi:carbon-monoxide dehydrogenase large subunit